MRVLSVRVDRRYDVLCDVMKSGMLRTDDEIARFLRVRRIENEFTRCGKYVGAPDNGRMERMHVVNLVERVPMSRIYIDHGECIGVSVDASQKKRRLVYESVYFGWIEWWWSMLFCEQRAATLCFLRVKFKDEV